jgi:hypothetical protein
MSLVRELHHRLREALRRELRSENALVRDTRPEQESTGTGGHDRSAVEEGPEVPDLPMGIPAEPTEGDTQLPGFPRDDPSHG